MSEEIVTASTHAIDKLHKTRTPAWQSTKLWAYVFTGALLAGALALSAPEAVSAKLAGALELGLPILLGAQGAADWARTRAMQAAVTAPKEA